MPSVSPGMSRSAVQTYEDTMEEEEGENEEEAVVDSISQ